MRATLGRMGTPNPNRLALPDILRGVAIIAMVIAHAEPFLPNSPAAVHTVTSLVSSLAAPLFALVMGMSAQLVWDAPRAHAGRVLWRQGVKAAALFALGFWMTTWGSWVAIVLQYLGLVLLIGVPLLLLPRLLRLIVALVGFVVTPPLHSFLAQVRYDIMTDSPGMTANAWQPQVLAVLGGGSYYWVTELIGFFLIGSLLVRIGLGLTSASSVLVAASVLFIPVELVLAQQGYPTPTWLDICRDIAVVALVVAVAHLMLTRQPLDWLTDAIRDIGRVSLSIYVVHVLFIATYAQWHISAMGTARPSHMIWWAWTLTVIGIPLLGMLWWRFVGTGPIEWVLRMLEGRSKPASGEPHDQISAEARS